MDKFIYKITNTLNGKMYIGQTNNYKRRFREHKNFHYSSDEEKILYLAIKKYGLENFSFELIEKVSNYNEREKFWIKELNTVAPNGYNITEGGDEPPILKGEQNPNTTHTLEQVKQIRQLLATTNKTTKEIGVMFNYDESAVQRINRGLIWYDENIGYPIRENTNEGRALRALNIIDDLLNSTLSQEEIAKKYNVGRTTVTAINNGQNHKQSNLEYPIRKTESIMGKEKKAIAQYTLDGKFIQTFESGAEAARALGLKRSTGIRACANGQLNQSAGFKWKFI